MAIESAILEFIYPGFVWVYLSKSYFIQSMIYSSVTNIDSPFDTFVFHLYCTTFSIFWAYFFECFYPDALRFSRSTKMFSFFNHPISFIYAPNIRLTALGTPNVFCHIPRQIGVLDAFSIISIKSSCVSYQLGVFNFLLMPNRIIL